MPFLPFYTGTILIVRIHIVIMWVHPSQYGTPRRTAHRRGNKRIVEPHSFGTQILQRLCHGRHGT